MAEQETKRGIIYCRVSSKEQVDNTSLESQERFCREYARRNNIEINIPAFVDRGESAKTADRPEFQRAIAFCSDKKNKISVFLVYKLDRFARNQEDHVSVRTVLKRYGVDLRSASEPIADNPIGKALEGVLSVFAEFDNNVRTERTRSGMRERLKQGVWTLGAPVGYHRPVRGSNIAPDPLKANYIRLAFEEYAKNRPSYKVLAKFLADRGFRTTHDKKPCAQLIEKILKNPLYCGIMKVGDWGEFEGNFEALISKELFFECQGGIGRRPKLEKRKSKHPDFPLKGCPCDLCLKPLTASYSRGRGGRYPYYHHQKQDCPKSKFISKLKLEKAFIKFLTEVSPTIKYEKAFRAIMIDIWQSNYKKFDEMNGTVRRDLERLEEERQKVFELHRSGRYNDDEFLEQKNFINERIYAKRTLLEENHVEEFNMEEALDYCFNFIRNSAKTWERLEYEQKLRFQNQIFEEKPKFDGEKFGTPKLSTVYAISKQYRGKKSQLAAPTGFEPVFLE